METTVTECEGDNEENLKGRFCPSHPLISRSDVTEYPKLMKILVRVNDSCYVIFFVGSLGNGVHLGSSLNNRIALIY